MAVAFGLALLGPAQHGVELVDGLVRQQRAQEHDGVADGGQVGMEIAVGEPEQPADLASVGDQRIGADAVVAAVIDICQRDDARQPSRSAECAANQVGTAIAVEDHLQQLDGDQRLVASLCQIALQAVCQPRGVGGNELGIAAKLRIAQKPFHGPHGRFSARINLACDRVGDLLGGFDIERDELHPGIDAAGLEQAAGERVEESLVELRIQLVGDGVGIRRMDVQPQRARQQTLGKQCFEATYGLADALIVKGDSGARVAPVSVPFAAFEASSGAARDVGEPGVVVVEGVDDERRGALDQLASCVGRWHPVSGPARAGSAWPAR